MTFDDAYEEAEDQTTKYATTVVELYLRHVGDALGLEFTEEDHEALEDTLIEKATYLCAEKMESP